MTADVLVERRDGVAVVTVSDPDRRNALTSELSDRLADAVTGCDSDTAVHAIVLAGAAPAFCAGGDLGALAAAGQSADPADLHRIYAGFLAVARAEVPTIAAVNGPAIGAGLNLALACDLRLAGPGARFDARFLQLGIHPGGGMTWLLQRAVGPQTAAAVALFGEPLDAAEAVRTGLAHRLVDTGEHDVRSQAAADVVVAAAVALAARTAAAPRELVTTTKATMRATSGMTAHTDAVDREVGPQLASLGSDAFARTIAAARAR